MRLVRALIDHVRNDYAKAKSLWGYLKRRMVEKTTLAAVASAIVAANALKPSYAAATIVLALVIALLPSPGAIAK
jgi:hypothetical protein